MGLNSLESVVCDEGDDVAAVSLSLLFDNAADENQDRWTSRFVIVKPPSRLYTRRRSDNAVAMVEWCAELKCWMVRRESY